MRKIEPLRPLKAALLSLAICWSQTPRAEATPAKPTPSIQNQTASAMRFGDFSELERLYVMYGTLGTRSPDTGFATVNEFWDGISEIMSSTLDVSEQYYTQLDALTRKWAVEHPKSRLAHFLYAKSLHAHGWYRRGSGYSKTVTQESWAALAKYNDLALDHLRQHEALLSQDSTWYKELLTLGRGAGWELDSHLKLFDEAIRKFPQDEQLYFTMQTTLLPKWSGSLVMVEQFIDKVTQGMPEPGATEMYARLYAALSDQDVDQNLFSDTRVSWQKMKAGFESRLSRHPTAYHRLNLIYYACMARDLDTLRAQLDQLDENVDLTVWDSRFIQRFEECKTLARKL